MKIKIFGLLMLIILAVGPSQAAPVTWTWDAPADGTPVVHYELQARLGTGEWTTVAEPTGNQATFDQVPNLEYTFRVRGIDAEGHAGEWSPVSDPYTYGAPGGCGKPGRVQ